MVTLYFSDLMGRTSLYDLVFRVQKKRNFCVTCCSEWTPRMYYFRWSIVLDEDFNMWKMLNEPFHTQGGKLEVTLWEYLMNGEIVSEFEIDL